MYVYHTFIHLWLIQVMELLIKIILHILLHRIAEFESLCRMFFIANVLICVLFKFFLESLLHCRTFQPSACEVRLLLPRWFHCSNVGSTVYYLPLLFYCSESMHEAKPHAEATTTRKVLIKTIETRDGQVGPTPDDCHGPRSLRQFVDFRPFELEHKFCDPDCPLLSFSRWSTSQLRITMTWSSNFQQEQNKEPHVTVATSKKTNLQHTTNSTALKKCLYIWWPHESVSWWRRWWITFSSAEVFCHVCLDTLMKSAQCRKVYKNPL